MLVLWLLVLPALTPPTPQDLVEVLQRADRLFEEAKGLYEKAKAIESVEGLTAAAFKLEEARAKYAALVEIGEGDPQKQAGDRIKQVQQLSKLIGEARASIAPRPPPPKPAENPGQPVPGKVPPPVLPPPPAAAARAAVPEPSAAREAEKAIRQLFQAEYAKKAPADRRLLAQNLLSQADQSPAGSVERWTLYREARECATQGGDADLVVRAIDGVSREFQVDSVVLKLSALGNLAKSARTTADQALLADHYFQLCEEAVASEDLEPARRAFAAAEQAARRTGHASFSARASQAGRDFSEIKSRSEAYGKALETLLKDSNHPAANLEAGLYLCFVKGDWGAGLHFLARGPDAALKAAAERDLASPAEPAAQVSAGDAWGDLADREKSTTRKNRFFARMTHWYQLALPAVTGIQKARLEKRIEMAAPPFAPVDLLPLMEGVLEVRGGQWSCDGRSLACTQKAQWAHVQIPYQPPDEYDLNIIAERREGVDALQVGLVCGPNRCHVAIDGFLGTVTGIACVDGKWMDRNDTSVKGRLLTNDKPSLLSLYVRKDAVTLEVDGKKVISWRGAFSRLSNAPELETPNGRALFIGCWDSKFVVTRLTLTPVSGRGRPLR